LAHLVSGAIEFRVIGPDSLVLTKHAVIHALGTDWDLNPGDITDLASLPWFGYLIYEPYEAAGASAWHDKRYKKGDISRKRADKGWREIAVSGDNPKTRMPEWKAKIGYRFLRLFGGASWLRHRYNEHKIAKKDKGAKNR